MLIFMVISTAVNKCFMFYFGINYTNHPGRGYGWGLAATLLYMLCSAGYLIYRYRDHE
ncbi:MAG TPA: hypothetical protein VFV50_17615 [Bdellovibrionales bacterium]|nr:hypothetical protein [Bdellovibrionales bacterium]